MVVGATVGGGGAMVCDAACGAVCPGPFWAEAPLVWSDGGAVGVASGAPAAAGVWVTDAVADGVEDAVEDGAAAGVSAACCAAAPIVPALMDPTIANPTTAAVCFQFQLRMTLISRKFR